MTKKATTKNTTPKKPRQKSISLKQIQKEYNDISKMSTYVINQEKNEVIKYYSKFDQKKIQDILTECYEKIVYVEEQGIEYFKNEEQFISYLNFLTIKTFTHFNDEIGDTFEEHIQAMNALIGLGYYKLILNDVFDGNEVYNVIQTMKDYLESVQSTIALETKENEKNLRLVKNAKV